MPEKPKRKPWTVAYPLIFLLLAHSGAAQQPEVGPVEPGIQVFHCQKSDSAEDGDSGEGGPYTISMNVEAVPGPQGLIQIPPGLSFDENLKKDRQTVSESFWFPSVYFYISASPYLTPVRKKDETSIGEILGLDQDVKWFDVTIALEAHCKSDELTEDCSLKVISLLPSRTDSGAQDRLATRIAGAVESLGGIVAPFFPGSSFNAKLGASGGALRVLFQNLFPPRVVANQFAFLSRADQTSAVLGWFFKRKRDGEDPSILGLHQGIALLQVGKDVAEIEVRYSVLSEWQERTRRDNNTKLDLQICDAGKIAQPRLKPAPDLDYSKLKSLEEFPMLIPSEEAEKILHLEAAALLEFLTKARISLVPMTPAAGTDYWVVRHSLQGFLERAKEGEAPEKKP